MQKALIALAVFLIGRIVCAQVPVDSSREVSGSALSDPVELETFMDGAVEALLEAHDVAGGTVSVVKDRLRAVPELLEPAGLESPRFLSFSNETQDETVGLHPR